MRKLFVVLAMLVAMNVSGQRSIKIISQQYYPNSELISSFVLNANNISSGFYNTGIFNRNWSFSNTPGFEWPKGSGRYAIFTAGLCMACGINGQYAQVMASYSGEYAPGRLTNGNYHTDSTFKMYSVKTGDSAQNNPDYANWYRMVPYGAPYDDVNNNGIYDNGIDKPGIKNAAQTLFEVMTDCDISQHNPGEGFGGGITSPLLVAEVAWTSWAYTYSGLEDVQFIRWRIINKGNSAWDSTFMGIVSDPDLGDYTDDYIGCDTILQLGFCYNSDNNDGTGTPPTYGASPPAVGIDLFRGAVKKGLGGQTVTLGMSSFSFYTDVSSSPPPCESDPTGEPVPAYHMLQGLKKDRTFYMDITKTPPRRTKYCYYGDPETQLGWTENKGSMKNCNRDTTGIILPVNPSGDRRLILSTGRLDFRVLPNDTQTIVIGQMIARGTNNLNSVTLLKTLSQTAQTFYNLNFSVPVINLSSDVPSKYSLSKNYPNPFNPNTNVKFSIVKSGNVKLIVYDVMGREVQTLVNERLQPGTYEASFDGSMLNSGVYFYKLITDGFSKTKKMLMIK